LLYQPPVATLLRTLKFGGQLTGLSTLAALVTRSPFLEHFTPPDYIVPVPLHRNRLRQRGFNQARIIRLLLLAALARSCQNRPAPARSTHCSANTTQRRRAAKQPEKSLTLADGAQLTDERVLLVDDVFTTGSTVSECSHVLRVAGAARIEVFTLARSLSPLPYPLPCAFETNRRSCQVPILPKFFSEPWTGYRNWLPPFVCGCRQLSLPAILENRAI
jgi:ComF family protein